MMRKRIFLGVLVLCGLVSSQGLCKTQLGLFCEKSLDGSKQIVPKSVEYTQLGFEYIPGTCGNEPCRILAQNSQEFHWTYTASPGMLLLTKMKWREDIKKFVADADVPINVYQNGEIESASILEPGYYSFHFGEMTDNKIYHPAKFWDFVICSKVQIENYFVAANICEKYWQYILTEDYENMLLLLSDVLYEVTVTDNLKNRLLAEFLKQIELLYKTSISLNSAHFILKIRYEMRPKDILTGEMVVPYNIIINNHFTLSGKAMGIKSGKIYRLNLPI